MKNEGIDHRYAFQVLYFYGLPASVNFGKLFIDTMSSVVPVANSIGVFPT